LAQQQQHRNQRHLPTVSAPATDSVKTATAGSSDDDGGFLNPPQCRRRQQQVNPMSPATVRPPSPQPPPPPPRRASLNQLPPASAVFERPETCKLSAALRKRAHNHYLPGCMNLSELRVSPIGFYFASSSTSSQSSTSSPTPSSPAAVESFYRDARIELSVTVGSDNSNWTVIRTLTELVAMDAALHRCCLQRCAHNRLDDLGAAFNDARFRSINNNSKNLNSTESVEQLRCRLLSECQALLSRYFKCLTSLLPIVGDRITCPMVLDPLEINCNGERLSNAVELAVTIAEFRPAANDELELRIGDYVALTHVTVNVDQPTWWQGKIVSLDTAGVASAAAGGGCLDSQPAENGPQQPQNKQASARAAAPRIGFFPSNCVRILAGPDASSLRPTPIRTRFGHLLPALRAFFRSRPDAGDLRPSGILRPALFGSDLSSACAVGQWDRDGLPAILLHCVTVIERHGSQQQGIYRRSGNAIEIQHLREAFEHLDSQDCSSNSSALSNRCLCDVAGADSQCPLFNEVHNYASLLKAFFRELAVPLLGSELADCSTGDGPAIKESLLMLPPAHIRVAAYLFGHLNRLTTHSDTTLMSSRNLGLVWAPNLCQQLLLTQEAINSPDTDLATVAKQSLHLADVIAYIIDHRTELFPSSAISDANHSASSCLPVFARENPNLSQRSNPLAVSIRRAPSNRKQQQQQPVSTEETARMRQACQQLYSHCPRLSAPKRRQFLLQPLAPPPATQPK
uniref:Rho-GAP domain-containing protein n=1 Tax=Macrostomum lignano TaxID=282301 RepID=A0A1I8HPF7_9PLAT